VIAAIVMGGCAYTSYRIGFREGSGSMIDFVRSKRNRAGYTTMHFFGDQIEFVDHLGKNDCHIACISEQMDTSTVQGRFFYIVFAALAELRRNEIKERVKMGMQGARAKGLWLGSPPYGYDMSVEVDDAGIRKQKGILVVNEKEAIVIQAMFKILDSGGDITDIINWCAENGHKSRTGRAVWHRSSISKIIDRRNLYETGSVLVDGVEISGVQPSILKSNRDTTEEE